MRAREGRVLREKGSAVELVVDPFVPSGVGSMDVGAFDGRLKVRAVFFWVDEGWVQEK